MPQELREARNEKCLPDLLDHVGERWSARAGNKRGTKCSPTTGHLPPSPLHDNGSDDRGNKKE